MCSLSRRPIAAEKRFRRARQTLAGQANSCSLLTPSVHFTVDFVKPTRYGDRLTFFLWTTKIGKTSCELRIEASHQGELRMRVKQVLVFISAGTSRSTPIPPELISRMHRFELEAEPAPADTPVRKRKPARVPSS